LDNVLGDADEPVRKERLGTRLIFSKMLSQSARFKVSDVGQNVVRPLTL
jgi:hypothetical protein